jgi:imidazolonepropionase-like amidohydrolase
MDRKCNRANVALKLLRNVACLALSFQWHVAIAQDQGKLPRELKQENAILITGRNLFDGTDFRVDQSLLIEGSLVVEVGPSESLKAKAKIVIDLGDATILPGFIELHAHSVFRHVPSDVILRHGVTTVRDVGGPLLRTSGGLGALRLLTSGPIITVQKGYPISTFGKGYIAEAADTVGQATALVKKLIEGGASVIKIALEPGGELGAPWSQGHQPASAPPWPIASQEIVSAIVSEAHRSGKIVTAHVGENTGASISLASGVDEWAHVPCLELDDAIIQQAARQGLRVVSTLDTLSHCPGVFGNARKLAKAGVLLLYGAEIAHIDVPWGIDAEELQLMRHATGMSDAELFRSATSKAGRELGMEPLGRLIPGAPADIIAVKGNPRENLKILEYPDLVVSGGRIVLDNFSSQR